MQLSQTAKVFFSSVALVAVLIMANACEPAFNPINSNSSKSYSVFGFLNASADTQFVRVEYLRDSLATDAPEALNADVQLTNTATGQSAMLHDSLFHYRTVAAHNYYTTMDIEPNQSYRLEVSRGNAKSSAEVAIPKTFPKPKLAKSRGASPDFLVVQDIDRLIAVKTIYHTCQDCGGIGGCPAKPHMIRDSFAHLQDTVRMSDGRIKAMLKTSDDLLEIGNGYPSGQTFTVVKSEAIIAAGNAEWPDFLSLDQEAVALPQVASNIDDGAGLLGGILTDTITVETNSADPCYNSSKNK